MTELVIVEGATREDAKRIAATYVASFANQPHEPRVLLEQIASVLEGLPLPVCEGVVNPQYGAITRSDKPCLKTLRKFIDDWMGTPVFDNFKRDRSNMGFDRETGEWFARDERPPTDAERERVKQITRKVKAALRVATVSQYPPKHEDKSLLSDEQNAMIDEYLKGGTPMKSDL